MLRMATVNSSLQPMISRLVAKNLLTSPTIKNRRMEIQLVFWKTTGAECTCQMLTQTN